MDKKPLMDKVALVTGGSQGIGCSIVNRFLEEGASVIIADMDDYEYEKNFKKNTKSLLFIKANLTLSKDIENVYKIISKKFKKLNILVNNAAILDATPLNELTMSRFNHVINNNLNSVLSVSLKFINLFTLKH